MQSTVLKTTGHNFLKLKLCSARITGYFEPGLVLKLPDKKLSDVCVSIDHTNICITHSFSSRHRKILRLALTLKHQKH